MAKKTEKGAKYEEMLRNYFLKSGYYVARGVPFKYEGFDVTDIDLWMYGRTSSVSREIAIVDIKSKKTPQAIERIFWVSGLKAAINANIAIVATTDRRKEVKDFGSDLSVIVIDGFFLNKLEKLGYAQTNRLSNEEFNQAISSYTLGKLDGDWKGRIVESKSALASGLSFNNCNFWLEQARFFSEQILTKPKQVVVASRCLYMISSYMILAIDYLLKELSFLDETDKKMAIKDGFTHGDRGKVGTDKLINFSLSLVDQYSHSGSSIIHEVRRNIEEQLSKLPSQILAEYFSRNEIANSLFVTAKELEELAMLKDYKNYTDASIETRGVIGVILDYLAVDRKAFNECIKNT